jgi:hypothetical protein
MHQQLLKILKVEPPSFEYEIENFYWLINQIIYYNSLKRSSYLKQDGFVSISSKLLDHHIPETYAMHLRYLEEHKLIHCDHKFSLLNNIAKGYKINSDFVGEVIVKDDYRWILPSAKIWTKSKEYRESKKSHKAMLAHYKQLKKCFNETKFDFQGAREYVIKMTIKGKNKETKRLSYLNSIDRFEDKRLRNFSIGSNGRLNTNFTNMKKELRKFIVGDKVMIDLSNSQPYLLGQVFKLFTSSSNCSHFTINYNKEHPVFIGIHEQFKNPPAVISDDELARYISQSIDGTLYEQINNSINLGWTRKRVKKKFLSYLYCDWSDVKYYKEIDLVFRKEYPTLWHILWHLKSNKYNQLAITLQRLEADIFIETIARFIVEQGMYCITVHDSVIIDRKDHKKILQLMQETFKSKFNEVPNFKSTNLDDSVFVYDYIITLNFDSIPFKLTLGYSMNFGGNKDFIDSIPFKLTLGYSMNFGGNKDFIDSIPFRKAA